MEHDVVLSGEGLRLRPFRRHPDDVALVVAIAADPQAWQWSASLRRSVDTAGATAWIEARLARPRSYEWVVEDDQSGAALGRVGLHRHAPDGDLEVGYWTLPAARGRGVARQSARLVARFAHEVLAEPRVGLQHAVANRASCRVALAASYRLEGTLRGAFDHGDGIRWDAHQHARLAGDGWDPEPMPMLPPAPVEVVGDGVVLRAWTHEAVPALLRAAADPATMQWNPLRISSEPDARQWVERVASWDDTAAWAVYDSVTDRLAGSVTLHQLDATNAVAEAGYWVLPEERGRGVGGRALQAAAGYAFDQLQVERVELFHAVANVASCRVAEAAGFALEGVPRRSYRYGDGQLHDEHLHGRLRSDERP